MPGQHGRADAGWVAAVSALLALVLAAGVSVAVLRSSTASADTVLARGAGAVLELADGTVRPAVEGQTVPRGATVRAGVLGARLDTRDREVHVSGDGAVTVVDGATQELRSGFVVVDATDAPGLELRTRAAAVEAADDSLVRVDGGPLVRVGVLRGDEAAVRPDGRRARTAVPTYFSVQVPDGGSPSAAVPFALTPGDAYERLLAPELVMADADLTALGARLDAGSAAGRAVLAELVRAVPAEEPALLPALAPAAAPAAPSGEQALGYLVASAAGSRDPLPQRYATVRDLRDDGGSWGVVAAIVAATVDDVGSRLGDLLGPATTPLLAGGPLDVGAVLDGPGQGPGLAPGLSDPTTVVPTSPVAPGSPSSPAAPPPGSGGSGTPPPTDEPVPPPPPPPVPLPTDPVVDEVVETVLDLLGPEPEPAGEPAPLAPVLEPVAPVLEPVAPVLEPLAPVLEPLAPALDPVLDPLLGLVS